MFLSVLLSGDAGKDQHNVRGVENIAKGSSGQENQDSKQHYPCFSTAPN